MSKLITIGGVAIVAAGVVAATSFAGPASPGPTAQAAAAKQVKAGDNFFSPFKVTVLKGGKVTWTNKGKVTHNATANSGAFNTGNFGPGQTRTVKFRAVGKIPYTCTIHSGMKGKIIVTKAG